MRRRHQYKIFLFVVLGAWITITKPASKQEFRGTWISVINQEQYKSMNVSDTKRYFVQMLDDLQKAGFNAIIFQIRPCADAFYYSEIEPWSRYLMGTQGQAPIGNFDPMSFLIEETHRRCMEFHAWINPYRAKASEKEVLDSSHIYFKHPEWFIPYGGQLYFNPGLEECQQFICSIVKDIIVRYDVDAIHMDDYFYPYPTAGEKFTDEKTFKEKNNSHGFSDKQKDDWRRENVNCLIQKISETISSEKKSVRFGISPFGIYRNRSANYPQGSHTNGLQNYDDLYADVQLWAEKGWIDYIIPQLYWEIGNKKADYKTLIRWWAKNKTMAQLYIGQSVERTMHPFGGKTSDKNQLIQKMELSHTFPEINGNCFWSAYDLLKNDQGILDSLQNHYYQYPSLIPPYSHMQKELPQEVRSLRINKKLGKYFLEWERNGDPKNPIHAQYFVIYCFSKKEIINLQDPSKIIAITRDTSYTLPFRSKKEKITYIVTAVNRFHNESKKGIRLIKQW